MDSKAIKTILEKYWEGETSLEEEASLRAYFQQEEVPAELQVFQPMFRFFEQEQEAYLNGDFDERLSTKLMAADIQKPGRHSLTVSLRRVAAVAAVLIGVLFFVKGPDILSADALNSKEKAEAKMAYAEAKAALLLISKKLNKGTNEAQSGVAKVRKATKVIRE